jgi:unsaturated chondroitin disaccharide hydrolase
MPAHGSWTVGFMPGMLWLAHRATGRAKYADEALASCRRFLARKEDDSTHDLGFVFYPSYVQGYQG